MILLLCEACQPRHCEVKTYRVDPATCAGCGRTAACDKVSLLALLECARRQDKIEAGCG